MNVINGVLKTTIYITIILTDILPNFQSQKLAIFIEKYKISKTHFFHANIIFNQFWGGKKSQNTD